MSGDPDTKQLMAEVEALRSALAELAVTQAEGLNALTELTSLVGYLLQGPRPPAFDLIYPDVSEVASKAKEAGAQALTVARRLLQQADDG